MANKYFQRVLIPDAVTETTLYTVPAANTGVLRSLRVTNANSVPAIITVTQYSSGNITAHYLLKAKYLVANGTFDVFNGVPCVLETGDVLKVTSSIGSVHFYLSFMEIDRN